MGSATLFEQVRQKITTLRDYEVILDADVAVLYGVETKRINEAVRNNPDKFPENYMFTLTHEEVASLRSKISTTSIFPKSRVLPKAFTEKGLYVLATILKSKQAINATLAIIETFATVLSVRVVVPVSFFFPETLFGKSCIEHGANRPSDFRLQ